MVRESGGAIVQRRKHRLIATFAVAALLELPRLASQSAAPQTAPPQNGQSGAHAADVPDRPTDVTAQFSPDQRGLYNTGLECFRSESFPEALAAFRKLLPQLTPGTPGQVHVAKFAAEAAIDAGDRQYALDLLKPIEAADPNDWQASCLLARVYAEKGEKEPRDAEIAHAIDLHKRAVSPQIAKMQQFLLERIPLASGSVRVWYSLEPWGQYKTYLFARVYDGAGQQAFRVSLESADFDQPLFAKDNPDLAAKGVRLFSLDGYGNPQKLPNGNSSFTHATFGFFKGQPSYDSIRERIVKIAEERSKPASQTEHAAP
jgi:tetratricopeptide (TPR) repeat protein